MVDIVVSKSSKMLRHWRVKRASVVGWWIGICGLVTRAWYFMKNMAKLVVSFVHLGERF